MLASFEEMYTTEPYLWYKAGSMRSLWPLRGFHANYIRGIAAKPGPCTYARGWRSKGLTIVTVGSGTGVAAKAR